MDKALALWLINPKMEYLLVDGEIVEWRSELPQPTDAEMQAALDNYTSPTPQQTIQEQLEQLKAAVSGDTIALAVISAEVAAKK